MATTRKSHPVIEEVSLVDESADSVAKRTLISLTVALGFFLLLGFLYLVRAELLSIVIASVFALALAPFVGWLVDRGWPRLVASLVAVLLSLLLLGGILGAASVPLISQGTKLVNNFPQIIQDISKNETVQRLDGKYHFVSKAQDAAREAPHFLSNNHSSILNTARTTFGAVASTIVITVLTFFLLLEGPNSWETFTALLKPRYGRRVYRTGENVAKAVGGYVSGNLFISLIAAIVSFVAMTLLHIPYAFPLAIIVAIFDLIPLVGASMATLIVGLVGLSVSVFAAIAIVAIIIIYQNVEGHAIQPIVYSRTVQLSPLLVLVATLMGATIGGIIGVLLAIPAAAVVQIIIIELLQGTAPGKRAHLSEPTAKTS